VRFVEPPAAELTSGGGLSGSCRTRGSQAPVAATRSHGAGPRSVRWYACDDEDGDVVVGFAVAEHCVHYFGAC
jgi:hypothetical protein